MVGTIPVAGNLSMSVLAATLTRNEQDFSRLTALTTDTANQRNLATFVEDDSDLGELSICAIGAVSSGQKILSATAYINGTQEKIDVYRLPA